MSSRRIMHPRVASVADTASQAIKDAVFEAIRKPSFDASLPPLSDTTWAKLIGSRAHAERERLEFVGDALMYATIGTILYKQIPDGTPHMYTVCSPPSKSMASGHSSIPNRASVTSCTQTPCTHWWRRSLTSLPSPT